jgi:hypothetical protein
MKTIDAAVVDELLRKEQLLLDPDFRRDRSRVAALLADDFVEFGVSGRVWSRDAILDLLAAEDYVPPAMDEFACRPVADGVVLVTYRTVRSDPESGQHDAALRSSLWTLQSGQWALRFHQGTRAS